MTVNHAVVDIPHGYEGKEIAKDVLDYRVGPACNWEFFRARRGTKLILWGDTVDEELLRTLGDATHEYEQEMAGGAMYDSASAADRLEGNFVFNEIRGDET